MMNGVTKKPLEQLGYGFTRHQQQNGNRDEYHIRSQQTPQAITYRNLTAKEIEVLVRNRNLSDDWNQIRVSDVFNPNLIYNCKFFGLIRIGRLEPFALEHHNLQVPVGLYNSTIISCDFGDNVVVDNVNYLSHYIVGDEVMLVNINEMVTTPTAKFGNGMLKKGEDPSRRIEIELCNENGGRKIIPFEGILPGDAYLWSRDRADEKLQQRYLEFTEARFDTRAGYYGTIGSSTVIKNTKMIKDVRIGEGVYIKGANKIKNITIQSSLEAPTQIGEGCELVNGIIGEGCRIFYGVKAVRFIMASHSQLKYGARLINSFLGNNSTISCCEVLNSLIFPGHEQHHNNSFLCASLLMGQSNMAAGATIGSNHNSRSADGELVAGRGFWPGLCVSLKHNSKLASFVLLAKGDYPAELNMTIPFSLVANDVQNNQLVVMPAYWFLHNMYALMRNCRKSVKRDQRLEKKQHLHYGFLEPDTVYELVQAIRDFETWTGQKFFDLNEPQETVRETGKRILTSRKDLIDDQDVVANGLENSDRPVVIRKIVEAYDIFRRLIRYNLAISLIGASEGDLENLDSLVEGMEPDSEFEPWENVGGQLIPLSALNDLKSAIKSGEINSWEDIHTFYLEVERSYNQNRLKQAIAAFRAVFETQDWIDSLDAFLEESVETMKWITDGIYESRAKDYHNGFRAMTYDSEEEMENVVGKLEDNDFIRESREETERFEGYIRRMIKIYEQSTVLDD